MLSISLLRLSDCLKSLTHGGGHVADALIAFPFLAALDFLVSKDGFSNDIL